MSRRRGNMGIRSEKYSGDLLTKNTQQIADLNYTVTTQGTEIQKQHIYILKLEKLLRDNDIDYHQERPEA